MRLNAALARVSIPSRPFTTESTGGSGEYGYELYRQVSIPSRPFTTESCLSQQSSRSSRSSQSHHGLSRLNLTGIGELYYRRASSSQSHHGLSRLNHIEFARIVNPSPQRSQSHHGLSRLNLPVTLTVGKKGESCVSIPSRPFTTESLTSQPLLPYSDTHSSPGMKVQVFL